MMDPMHLRYFLVVGAGASFLGLAISAMLLMQAQRQAERRDRRLAAVVEAHLRPTYIEMSAYGGAKSETNQSFLGTLGWIFGFDPDKLPLYPTRWWIALIGLLVVAKLGETVIAAFLGHFALLSVPAIWLLLSHNFFSYFVRRRQQKLLQEFPDALAMLVRAIRVGIPVMEAIRNVSRAAGPLTAAGFAHLAEQVSIGVSMEEALQTLARGTGLTEYRFFATTLTLQNQTGGTLSDTLESLADVIRKRAALKAKGRAMTSEARSSSMVLAVLPIVTGIMLWVINPKYIAVLFTDPAGQSMLGLAVILLTTGVLSIHAIIKNTLK